jgi:hypothetical protein
MLLKKVWRVCDGELRRVIGAIMGMLEHTRELDEQALRSLGVVPREPRSH